MFQLTSFFFLSFLLVVSIPKNYQNEKDTFKKLEQLVDDKDYFTLNKAFDSQKVNLKKGHSLYIQAVLGNVFNQPAKSNKAIDKILSSEVNNLTDTLLNNSYHIKLNNHINLYEYKDAMMTSQFILDHYHTLNDSSTIQMLSNELTIWNALRNTPKQTVSRKTDLIIPMVKDKVGLFNVDVTFGKSTKNFLFDTGANFSVIIKSLVDELGLKTLEGDFYVTAATGTKVKSQVAVAKELSLGELTIHNAVFLVLDDKDLSFPSIEYYPNGAIGFPIIQAMQEIRISKDDQIFVPKTPTPYNYNNFALEGLMPIIEGSYQGQSLRFNFDTGATSTALYPLFYQEYKEELDQSYAKQTFQSSSGGGTVEFEGYIIDDFVLKIADSQAELNNIRVHIDDIGGEESKFHGNFGQDYIRQFDEMIISFKYSSVLFN